MSHRLLCKILKVVLLVTILVLGSGCSLASNTNKKNEVNISQQQTQKAKTVELNKTDTSISKNIKEFKEDTPLFHDKGIEYMTKYEKNPSVRQLIIVEQTESNISTGKLFLFNKNIDNQWELVLECKALLGLNGIDKTREGDRKTPTGDFGVGRAFGAKDNPGAVIPYTKLTDTMYLCGDKEYYNQFIDISKLDHQCSSKSEHLLDYIPQYNYALIIDYNKECVYGKGSAIFLHCNGSNPFTLGCIGVTEENMIKILKCVDKNTRICIYQGKKSK